MKKKINQDIVRHFLMFLLVGLGGVFLGIMIASPQGGGVLRNADEGMTIRHLDSEALRAFIGQTYQLDEEMLRDGVVASRNGEVYYHPNCPGWGRIKEENRIWFLTAEEAEQEGYRIAKSCE